MDDWNEAAIKLPSENPRCGQAHVLFCSPGWGWPIVGLFTNLDGVGQWAAYDQQNDRFETWEGPAPELWMFRPNAPKAKSAESGVDRVYEVEHPPGGPRC